MGNPYNSQSISGYNANPPPDDASQVAANQLGWSKHKTKLGDPLKTLAEGINAEVAAAFGKLSWYTSRSISSSDSVVALDERKVLSCTNSITLTLLAAATAANGFVTTVFNAGSGTITIDGDGAETINGSATFALDDQYESVVLWTDGTAWFALAEKATATVVDLPRSYLAGLTLSNGADATNDINIAVGEAQDDANTAKLTVTTAIGKQIDASWAAGGTTGTPTGGLSSSLTLTNDTCYHVILGLVSGTEEVGFDTSITGANLVTDHSFTNTRRIGSVRRGTATNLAFVQEGDEFRLDAMITDDSTAAPGTSARTITLTAPVGVATWALLTIACHGTVSGNAMLVTSLDTSDVAPTVSSKGQALAPANPNSGTWVGSAQVTVKTNTSAQVRSRVAIDADTFIHTEGWIDRRGRDS